MTRTGRKTTITATGRGKAAVASSGKALPSSKSGQKGSGKGAAASQSVASSRTSSRVSHASGGRPAKGGRIAASIPSKKTKDPKCKRGVRHDRRGKRKRHESDDGSNNGDEEEAEKVPRTGRKHQGATLEETKNAGEPVAHPPTPPPTPPPLQTLTVPTLDKLDKFDLMFFSQAEYHIHLAASAALQQVLQSRVSFFELLQMEQRRRSDASSEPSDIHRCAPFSFADPPEPSGSEGDDTEMNGGVVSAVEAEGEKSNQTSHDDVYRTLRDALLATCALGHRSCMALWGPRGCGKHRILRFVCEVLTGNDVRLPLPTTTDGGHAERAAEQGALQKGQHATASRKGRIAKAPVRAPDPRESATEASLADGGGGFHMFAKAMVIHLDGRTLRGDGDALRSIAEQLLSFLLAAIDASKREKSSTTQAPRSAQSTKWKQRGGSVAAAAMLMEKDWSFHTGNFGFGLLFGFPQTMSKRRESEDVGNPPKRPTRRAAGKGAEEDEQRSDSASASSSSPEDDDQGGGGRVRTKGRACGLENEASESESDVDGGDGIFLTRTSAGPGGGVASALPALQEALLTMRSHGVSLVFCIRDAERFGVWCDQLMYVLSGMLHESSSSVRDVGGISLVLTSSAPDMQHLEKRLSSRLTCEMCFVPMIRATVEGLLFMCYRHVSANIQRVLSQSMQDPQFAASSLRSDMRRCWLRVQHAIVNGILVYGFSDRKQCRSIWCRSHSHRSASRYSSAGLALRVIHEKTLALQASGATLEAFASAAAGLLNQITSGAFPLLENRDRERLAAVCALRVRDVMGPTHHPPFSEEWEPRATRETSTDETLQGRKKMHHQTSERGREGYDVESVMLDVMRCGGAFASAPCKWVKSERENSVDANRNSQEALKNRILHRMPEPYVSFSPAFFAPPNSERRSTQRVKTHETQSTDCLLRDSKNLDEQRSLDRETSLRFNWSIGSQPPDLLDLMSTHGLIQLGYGSRELFLLHTYCVVHAGAGVAQRRVVDLLEDVASSLGTRAAASLDREAFRYALRQLVRLKIVSLTSSRSTALVHVGAAGKNGKRQTPFSMPPSNVPIGVAEEDTGLVSLIGSIARHKVYLMEVLESTRLSEQLLGLDSRERQSLRSML